MFGGVQRGPEFDHAGGNKEKRVHITVVVTGNLGEVMKSCFVNFNNITVDVLMWHHILGLLLIFMRVKAVMGLVNTNWWWYVAYSCWTISAAVGFIPLSSPPHTISQFVFTRLKPYASANSHTSHFCLEQILLSFVSDTFWKFTCSQKTLQLLKILKVPLGAFRDTPANVDSEQNKKLFPCPVSWRYGEKLKREEREVGSPYE